ncbi:hypothetical protein niasHS_014330 [Heterodera schachtii]|uniref:Uncharacterized protein n=2 Tax=Heterodera TaxID=34509 RepID=A0ABD2IAN4_HETSC
MSDNLVESPVKAGKATKKPKAGTACQRHKHRQRAKHRRDNLMIHRIQWTTRRWMGNRCVAKICGEPSVAHYFECCCDSGTDCCLRLNTWFIVLVSLLAFCLVACLVLCLVKCICLCCF